MRIGEMRNGFAFSFFWVLFRFWQNHALEEKLTVMFYLEGPSGQALGTQIFGKKG